MSSSSSRSMKLYLKLKNISSYILDILATFDPVTLETLKANNSYQILKLIKEKLEILNYRLNIT
jgi:hypothetical protein